MLMAKIVVNAYDLRKMKFQIFMIGSSIKFKI